jgi:hypothetical protein
MTGRVVIFLKVTNLVRTKLDVCMIIVRLVLSMRKDSLFSATDYQSVSVALVS